MSSQHVTNCMQETIQHNWRVNVGWKERLLLQKTRHRIGVLIHWDHSDKEVMLWHDGHPNLRLTIRIHEIDVWQHLFAYKHT